MLDPKTNTNTQFVELDELDCKLEQYKKHRFSVSPDKNEEVNDLGPLYFFKTFHANYPIQTCIALALFCITASSVPSESLFSIVGIIQNELRNRLAPEVLEDITFIKEHK